MRTVAHSTAIWLAAKLMKLVFGYSSHIHVIGREHVEHEGGFLLASNHISHFDPLIISSVVRRKIDWMAMAEFFPMPIVGPFLRAVDAFPAERDHADRKTIRTAIERLKKGRIVGLFPEGGIRDGARSLLEGAQLRPGASTLAHIAGVPILPCVILVIDRLYSIKSRKLSALRRTPVWIAFGNPISHSPGLEKSEARERVESELASSFKNLYGELQQTFRLTRDDLAHSPRERMKGRIGPPGRPDSAARRLSRKVQIRRGETKGNGFHRFAAIGIDVFLCASINFRHTRHRLDGNSRDEMERYVEECERLNAQQYYASPHDNNLVEALKNGGATIEWRSPIETQFAANNVARADVFPSERGRSAPTVLILHALMSASRVGYRRCAERFNELGWNACFIHLPYHYSRVPRGYWNGELAITCDLIRNAEGLRQGVTELRQLMSASRERASGEFGVLATSYGGWIGALIALVERDLRFV